VYLHKLGINCETVNAKRLSININKASRSHIVRLSIKTNARQKTIRAASSQIALGVLVFFLCLAVSRTITENLPRSLSSEMKFPSLVGSDLSRFCHSRDDRLSTLCSLCRAEWHVRERLLGDLRIIPDAPRKNFNRGTYPFIDLANIPAILNASALMFCLFLYRYADRSYRTHPRGLIIYGPATVIPSLTGSGNASSTTIFSILAKGHSNLSHSESMPIRNLVGGGATAREFSVANATSNATIPLCPLIPPNLGRSERIDEDARR